jgi:hypothetical protein
LLVSTRAGSAVRLLVFRTPLHWRLSLKPSFTFSNYVLVQLVLVGSSIARRTSALVPGVTLHKIMTAIRGGIGC